MALSVRLVLMLLLLLSRTLPSPRAKWTNPAALKRRATEETPSWQTQLLAADSEPCKSWPRLSLPQR